MVQDPHRTLTILCKARQVFLSLSIYVLMAAAPALHAQHFFPSQADWREPVSGAHPYLNVLIKFADTAGITPHPRAFYEKLLSNDSGGLDDYFRQISYGNVNLAGSQTLDWMVLPKPQAAYRSMMKPSYWTYSFMAEVLQRVDKQIDLTRFSGVNFFVNVTDDMTASQWTFWFELARGPRAFPVTMINPQAANARVVAHEMLHNWGFDHSIYVTADSSKPEAEPWDPMGTGGPNDIPTDVNGYHKYRAGWLERTRIYSAAPGSDQTIRIERLHAPISKTDPLLAIIPRSGAFGEGYTVEARRQIGYDMGIPADGVVIHKMDESAFNPAAAPPIFEGASQCVRTPPAEGEKPLWSPGQTFTDAQAGVHITILKGDQSGYTVRIQVDRAQTVTSSGIVTNARDEGAGSLRDALSWAQHHPGTKVRFAIPRTDSNFKDGVFTIRLARPLPYLFADGTDLTAPTQAENGYAAGGRSPGVFLEGRGIPVPVTGLVVRGARCLVKNLAVGRFGWFGIAVQGQQAHDNLIEDCYVGTNASGTVAEPNVQHGISVEEGAQTDIHRCLVSGNKASGIMVWGTWQLETQHTRNLGTRVRISECLVGTNRQGTEALSNGGAGITLLEGATGCTVTQNLVSGNGGLGIQLMGAGTSGNIVRGNVAGMDAARTKPLVNKDAPIAAHSGASNNVIEGNISYPQ